MAGPLLPCTQRAELRVAGARVLSVRCSATSLDWVQHRGQPSLLPLADVNTPACQECPVADRGPGGAARGRPQVGPRGGCSRQERPSGAGSQAARPGDGGLREGRAEQAAAGPVGSGLGSCPPPPLPARPCPPSQPRPEWLEPCPLPDLTVASSWTPGHFLCSGHSFSPSSLRPDTAHSPGAAPSEQRAGGQGVPQARGPDLPPQGSPCLPSHLHRFPPAPTLTVAGSSASGESKPMDTCRVPISLPPQARRRVLPRAFGLSPLRVCTARVPVPLLHSTCSHPPHPPPLQEMRAPAEGAWTPAAEAGGGSPEEPPEGPEVPEGLVGAVRHSFSSVSLCPPHPRQGPA